MRTNRLKTKTLFDQTEPFSADQLPQERLPALPVDRRHFLKLSLAAGAGLATCALLPPTASGGTGGDEDAKFIREALYYEKLPHRKIRCLLCPRECVIDDHERGYCGVRENRNGKYYTLVYGRACTYHIDPIEKKPLFHFLPGTTAFSVATAGCNVNCKFCQNWQISQVTPEQVRSIDLSPEKLARTTEYYSIPTIAYTYNEPTIFFEYMIDAAREGHRRNIKSVVITAAYIQQEPLKELCQTVDAIKVDLKAFSEKYYKEIVNGELKPVLDALITMRTMKIWTEIVYLVVPTLNDSETEITNLSRWIKQYLGADVPIHFTRFYPQYLLKNLPPTPVSTLNRCKQIADAEGLHYVYVGNVPGHPAESTYCPHCGKKLIDRYGYSVTISGLNEGHCTNCGQEIPGIWS